MVEAPLEPPLERRRRSMVEAPHNSSPPSSSTYRNHPPCRPLVLRDALPPSALQVRFGLPGSSVCYAPIVDWLALD